MEGFRQLKKTTKNNEEKSSEEKEVNPTQFWGLTSFTFYAYSLLLLIAGTNPATGLVVSLIGFIAMKKHNRAIKESGRLRQLEACERIKVLFQKRFYRKNFTIYSSLDDLRLHLGKINIDYIIISPSNKTYAISVRSILPAKEEEEQTRVYFDENKNKLGYRKTIKSGKKYFNVDPVESLKEGIADLAEQYPELVPTPPYYLIVMAEPTIINVHANSPQKTIGSDTYLYLNDAYIVEEKQLIALIRSLEKSDSSNI